MARHINHPTGQTEQKTSNHLSSSQPQPSDSPTTIHFGPRRTCSSLRCSARRHRPLRPVPAPRRICQRGGFAVGNGFAWELSASTDVGCPALPDSEPRFGRDSRQPPNSSAEAVNQGNKMSDRPSLPREPITIIRGDSNGPLYLLVALVIVAAVGAVYWVSTAHPNPSSTSTTTVIVPAPARTDARPEPNRQAPDSHSRDSAPAPQPQPPVPIPRQ